MCDERETRRTDARTKVSIDAVPDPVVGYEHRGQSLVIVEQNDAFESAFESIPVGTAVREWLTSATSADGQSAAAICSSLVDGDRVDTAVGGQHGADDSGGEYRLRTLHDASDSGAGDGFLVLTDVGSMRPPEVEVDRIASVISHDLRNPLDVANIHLRAARETGNSEHFDQVRQSHDRMERIIQDVLTLARGEHVLDVTAGIDIESVARDAWATVETESASLTVGDDLPTTDADPDRLQRLFENLFRNAVEHGPASPASQAQQDSAERSSAGSRTQSDDTGRASASEPSVADAPEDAVEHSSTSPRSQAPEDADDGEVGSDHGLGDDLSNNGLEVRVGRADEGFFVADDGVGITPGERERVFDPGYSANGPSDGTGLGLTIVERIAEAHDWTVSLTAGSAGGARFEFHPASDSD